MSEPDPTPPVLDYRAQPMARPVSLVRFGWPATLLLLANTLLGGAMVLAVFYADRLGVAAWPMVAAGTLLLYVVTRCLAVDAPRFRRALVFSAIACALCAVALACIARVHAALEGKIVGGRSINVQVPLRSDEGASLAALETAWDLTMAAGGAAVLLAGYITFCLVRVARARRARG